VEEIQDLIIGHYNRPTTLKRMFQKYCFPTIKFQNNLAQFPHEDRLEIKSLSGLGEYDSLNKKYAITNVKLFLNNFYFDPKPACPFTSERMTHRELAEIYYIRIIKNNDYEVEKIVEFIDNYCEYYHGSKHHYDYYNQEAQKDNRTQTLPWFFDYVNKVYKMTKNDKSNYIRSTIEKELKTFHCKSLYNKIHNEGKVMTADAWNALAALDDHIETVKEYFNEYFNLMLSNERIQKVITPEYYHYYFSSECSTFDYNNHKDYFEKAFQLFQEVRKVF
jgi:excinuclease UvrABC ATPase subunit